MAWPHKTLFYQHPYQVVDYWRAFLDTSSPEWPALLQLAYASMRDTFEILDAWLNALRDQGDVFQKRALDGVLLHLDKIELQMAGVAQALDQVSDFPQLWKFAAVPLAFGPGSIANGLASVRNQLLAYGAVPAHVTTSSGARESVSDWGNQQPSAQADWFQRNLSRLYEKTENFDREALEVATALANRAWGNVKYIGAQAAAAAGDIVDAAKVGIAWAPVAAVAIAAYVVLRK